MQQTRKSETIQLFGVAAAVIAADQLTKHFVAAQLQHSEQHQITVVPGTLRWSYEQNENGAFGLYGGPAWLLIAMAIAVLAIFWLSFREQARYSKLVRVAFGMILGGAIGNVIDRLQYRYVFDFIDFYLLPIWHYVFNIADASITVGVILLIAASLAPRRRA